MQWLFLIVSTLAWGIAEIFYKKGNLEREKYSHLKTTVLVGIFFGIYSLVILIIQSTKDITFLKSIPINMVLYLPVALCYLVSMTLSYFGVRFIEETISDPIENTSGAVVPILCAIFLHEEIGWKLIIAIVIIAIGIICLGFFDKRGDQDRKKRLGKKLAIIAFAMPFCYAMLDAVGTFLDIFYTDSAEDTILRNVTDDTIEHMANCCYEFIFFLVAMGILVFLKIKKVKFFSIKDSKEDIETLNEDSSDAREVVVNEDSVELKWYKKVFLQKDKILAALFETIGQATYLFALSEGKGIAAVILGAGTVITSVILSRIVLKEKLTLLQYIFVLIILAGIITLAVFDA